ncbi:hypothetical protein BCL76_105338 [Streptomyces sp. CG 926]|uniref:hypothetical protein n=1 Tax=Streptomyces sp. CG 926 TaxID=1882405 RepID=UPI000D6ADF39|nr:hypothetical protein [Streptomyces sp. CG 926]PWK70385.1 hypothetical protein BCL76_105338 [Streptomyces sp. CG 926]
MQYKYRFMKGGVGLAADLSAHTEESESTPSTAVQIYQRLHVRLPTGHIYWKDAAWLSYGLSLHATELSPVDEGHLLVVVDSFTYPGADYRSEVAALAIDGWVHQSLNTPPCGISVSFDRSHRQFRFDWGPGMVPFNDDLPG